MSKIGQNDLSKIIPQEMADAARMRGKGSLTNSFSATGADENLYSAKTGAVTESKLVEQALMGSEEARRILGNRTNALQGSDENNTDEKNKKTIDEYLRLQHDMLIERLEAIRAEIAQLKVDIQNVKDEMKQLKEELKGTNQAISEYDTTGEIKLNDKGELANSKAEEALKRYEKLTGAKVDRNDAHAVYLALLSQREWLDQNLITLQQTLDEKQRQLLLKQQQEQEILRTQQSVTSARDAKTPETIQAAVQDLDRTAAILAMRDDNISEEMKKQIADKIGASVNVVQADDDFAPLTPAASPGKMGL